MAVTYPIVRLALLCVAPLVAASQERTDMLMFFICSSLVASIFDLLRQSKRLLPFPIYLMLVYAAQTSWYVADLHAAAMDFQHVHATDDSAELPEVTGNIKTMTVVMAAHNEHEYMKRTLQSIYEKTPPEILKEIIVVDDGSTPPLADSFIQDFPDVKLIRHETRRGLIKSKTEGGNMATSDMIMFLDAHVKPEAGWAKPLLKHMNINYRRVVVPLIPILDGATWVTNHNAVGVKMMFDWSLFFNWFEDYNDLVPCMSGGLFGITRRWWHESGEYDYDMAMWGAENIEQSIRIWLCGGEIYVARNSKVAHVFRSKFPYPVNNTEIYMNKVRTVETWFDEYKQNYYDADPAARQFVRIMGNITARQELKAHLQCKPFKWYVRKFRDIFLQKNMLPSEIFLIRDTEHDRCVRSADNGKNLLAVECDAQDTMQQWRVGNEGNGLVNIGTGNCMDANAGQLQKDGADAFMYHCFPQNEMQVWKLAEGDVKWQNMCLLGSQQGRLKLTNCGAFLAGRQRFVKYLARGTNEADV